jgi:Uma2 family endonuclease
MATQISEKAPQYDVTYEEWLRTAPESRMSEWVKGKVIDFMPPSERHQDLLAWLTTVLNLFVRRLQLGKVIPAPFEMKLVVVPSSREPDILVVLSEHLERLDGKRLNGPADLAVEILSPDSVARDRRDKLAEYAAAGVQEYWIIDPRLGRYSFRVHRLNDDHYFEEIALREDGKTHCQTHSTHFSR